MYIVSDGSSRPYRCKIKAPGFAHLVSPLCISSRELNFKEGFISGLKSTCRAVGGGGGANMNMNRERNVRLSFV